MSSTLTAPSLSTAPAAAKPHLLWNEIVRWSLEACILRKEGRETEVAVLLQERLPELIRRWSASCGLPSGTCKQNLRALFQRVQESVETGYIHRRLIVEEVCARLSAAPAAPAPVPAQTGPVRLRQRIAIDDVPGMLDAIASAEHETRSEAILPMRRAARSMINLFSGEPSKNPVALRVDGIFATS
jgi:hypothetical protein